VTGFDADLLVAGGGPAGLSAAIVAAQAGLSAIVIEPRRGPIDKACGEGLMPSAVAGLQALGVDPPGVPFLGIRYIDGERAAEGSFSRGPGRGVRRLVLHEALTRRAHDLGIQIVEGRVDAVTQDANAVTAAGLRGRWLAGADGLHSPLRRRLGLALPPRRPARYGIRRHFHTAPWSDRVEVHLAPGGEAYVTPVAGDTVGVAVLFQGKGRYDDWLARFPAVRERLGEPCTRAQGAGPFEQRLRRRVVGRVLLIGDAAGYLDPLTGEGIRLGLESARALVRCLLADRPQRYERAWRRLARRYWWFTSALLRARRSPRVSRRLVPLLARHPRLFDWALDLLERDREPLPQRA
jgi:flavin-dependent dehydrogenase